MHILQYLVKFWDSFKGHLEALVTHHQTTGTLPPITTVVPAVPNNVVGDKTQKPTPLPPQADAPTTDTPDAKGGVAFTGLPKDNDYAGLRIFVKEVGLSLPLSSEQRECCLNAVQQADDKYNVGGGFIGVAIDSVQVKNESTGNMDWKIGSNPVVTILNSVALPAFESVVYKGVSYDCSTKTGAYAYLLASGSVPNHAVSN